MSCETMMNPSKRVFEIESLIGIVNYGISKARKKLITSKSLRQNVAKVPLIVPFA